VHVDPDNVLDANDVNLGGRLAITARRAGDYTRVHAAGDLALHGPLAIDVQGPINLGAVLTIATGRSVSGTFDGLPQGAVLVAGGQQFRVSYLSNAVTLTAIAESTVGGTVPATLSLTLGGPASFGAFTAGVDKTYTASTTADVISTAGDATLSVSDPGHLTNGAFSLPEALQVTMTPSSWNAPVSHGAVAIGFSQHIGPNDALRTGTYSKTLTFTLSTTSP